MATLLFNITTSDSYYFVPYSNIKKYLGPSNIQKRQTLSSSDIAHSGTYANTRSYYAANNSFKSLTISVDALTDRTIVNPQQAYIIF
jgi:hypothetical protein